MLVIAIEEALDAIAKLIATIRDDAALAEVELRLLDLRAWVATLRAEIARKGAQ